MVRELIVNKYRQLYGISFLIGALLLVGLLFINGWDISALISADYMLLLFTVSGITMKVLSGIGIMLTFASFCTIVFKLFSDGMKGDPSLARRVKLGLLIPLVAVAGYGIYKIVGIYFATEETLLDTLITIYGVWSLMLSVYVIPAVRGSYQPDYKESTTDKIKKRFGDAKYSLWSGYQTKIRKDYGKAYAKEFERYGERLDKLRSQLSGILLLPLGVALVIFPPLAMLLVVVWMRSFTLDKKPLTTLERGILGFVVMGMLLLSTLVILTLDIATAKILFDAVYGIGILTSIGVLGYIVVSS